MQKKLLFTYSLFFLFLFIFKPTVVLAQQEDTNEDDFVEVNFENQSEIQNGLTVSEKLEALGLTIQVDKPEGAILAFSLPDVYILPDSRLYWVVQLWESVSLLWADTPEEKSDLLFYFSEKRLSEIIALFEKNDSEAALTTIDRYKGQLSQAINSINEIQNTDDRDKRYSNLEKQVWYQQALNKLAEAQGLSDLLGGVTDSLKNNETGQRGIELTQIDNE
ncbi:hypothetical protein KC571_02980 [candidate division WWE3 bacterium]|uniref:DUF5667 domain-containing protein n=1 Tax=candidate division WWE3 bacterium TaxID=2053526 RepID=A0A955LGU8_UNCKA|nr:hypothetical protein [candidate division WWE3 bacterium]